MENKKERAGNEGALQKYLDDLGVARLVPATSPFDPGYHLGTLEGHLRQSHHLIETLKISMACWMIADEGVSRRKFAVAQELGIKTVTGGGPFEVAVAQGKMHEYLALCCEFGATRVECGVGFADIEVDPVSTMAVIRELGLEAQFEVGEKHTGSFEEETVTKLIDQGQAWLDAGATQIVVEGRENAQSVGLFADDGALDYGFAERFVEAYGIETVVFEAPNKPSQFAFMNHFGPEVRLCNVRLEEILRVEIYRRGLHSDAFRVEKLRPSRIEGQEK